MKELSFWQPVGVADVVQVTWRRLVLLYQLPGGDTASSTGLQRAKAVEDTLRSLPLWQRLCGEMPFSYQSLCSQGAARNRGSAVLGFGENQLRILKESGKM